MSERERPIREWNAVTYLRDFIQTGLILSPREQAVWKYLQKNRKNKCIGGNMSREYFFNTGNKFSGTEEEFIQRSPICMGNFCPITDENGFFEQWYCMKDWKICDRLCYKHRPPVNEDIKEFFEATCERYKK